jgi:hypothetical protein
MGNKHHQPAHLAYRILLPGHPNGKPHPLGTRVPPKFGEAQRGALHIPSLWLFSRWLKILRLKSGYRGMEILRGNLDEFPTSVGL